MEEDNAHDLYRCMVSRKLVENDTEEVTASYKENTFRAKLTLLGNILSCSAVDEAQVPLIFVLERIVVRKQESSPLTLILAFSDIEDSVSFVFSTESSLEEWMVKMATCSHQMARAELDELAYKFYTMSASDEPCPESPSISFHNYYLTCPHRVTHSFALSQQNSLPPRRLILEEVMWESKLSLILPAEMIKIYRKWIADFCCLLESRQNSWPSFAIPALHEVLREVRENTETYEQCHEFISNYSGPSFRKSTEKHRVAFGPVPTNLHLQVFGMSKDNGKEFLTCGTASAIPLRFQQGGLHRLATSLEVDPAYHDNAFWSKRSVIVDLKKCIGDLSHKLDVEWKLASFGKPDKVCLELHSGIKQVFERLKDTLLWISGVEQCAEMLMEEERRRQSIGSKVEMRVPDSLQNQLDNLDAMIISLHTKIAVIDTLDDEQTERRSYEKSARDAMSSCLDMLLTLADSLAESQLFGLVLALHKSSIAHSYYQIQLRSDFVLSQAISIGATAILSRIHQGWPPAASPSDPAPDLLLLVFSFLSAYGDERGMAEDAWEAWKMLESRVEFKLVRAPSTVCRNCIPMISGTRSALKVSLPLPHDVFDNLPQPLKSRDSIRVRPAYFNIGVNHEATLGQSFGGISFESTINQDGADRLNAYANRVLASAKARETVLELVNAVATEPSRKNLSIFDWALAACDALDGRAVLCCKSGKDRTGMAATLEQGRTLRETCGMNAAQVSEVVASLRRDGVRRENCKKNVGKAVYSFSPFQMHFLPKSFRPPNGTYAQGVAT